MLVTIETELLSTITRVNDTKRWGSLIRSTVVYQEVLLIFVSFDGKDLYGPCVILKSSSDNLFTSFAYL